jgi:Zn-dependent peptidase ImmA (M78 family)
MSSNLNLEKAASDFRTKYGYSNTNPIRVKSLLLELKVLTVFRVMEDSFSGMSLKIDNDRFVIINSAHSLGRQHFTIFHELYHLYIQKDFEHTVCGSIADKKEENNANVFAADLMLPRDGLFKLIPDDELTKDKISVSTLLKLEQYYSCSHSAMLRRLFALQLISKNMQEKLKTILIKIVAQEYGYGTELYEPGNKDVIIGDYGVKAKEFFDKEIISESHYLSLMLDLGIDFKGTESPDEQ